MSSRCFVKPMSQHRLRQPRRLQTTSCIQRYETSPEQIGLSLSQERYPELHRSRRPPRQRFRRWNQESLQLNPHGQHRHRQQQRQHQSLQQHGRIGCPKLAVSRRSLLRVPNQTSLSPARSTATACSNSRRRLKPRSQPQNLSLKGPAHRSHYPQLQNPRLRSQGLLSRKTMSRHRPIVCHGMFHPKQAAHKTSSCHSLHARIPRAPQPHLPAAQVC